MEKENNQVWDQHYEQGHMYQMECESICGVCDNEFGVPVRKYKWYDSNGKKHIDYVHKSGIVCNLIFSK